MAPVPGELLLSLGACGVRRFLDLNGRGGWDSLRGLLDGGGGEVEGVILNTLLPQLADASDEVRHFFAGTSAAGSKYELRTRPGESAWHSRKYANVEVLLSLDTFAEVLPVDDAASLCRGVLRDSGHLDC